MKDSNPVRDKSFNVAVRVAKFCLKIQRTKKEYVLTKQLLSSATSIGANVEEALQGQSRPDFISKLSISLKEACETQYWLRIVQETDLSTPQEVQPLLLDVQEVIRLLTAILKTSRST